MAISDKIGQEHTQEKQVLHRSARNILEFLSKLPNTRDRKEVDSDNFSFQGLIKSGFCAFTTHRYCVTIRAHQDIPISGCVSVLVLIFLAFFSIIM
jgi:hypothetical protein